MLMLLLLLWQEPEIEPEPINARVYMNNGDVMDLKEIQIRGIEPHAFEFTENGARYFLSIFRISLIRRLDNRGNYEVLLDSGETRIGDIGPVKLMGMPIVKDDTARVVTGGLKSSDITVKNRTTISLSGIERIHFISGFQLRACVEGHYEQYTPYPFCPVCGKELQIGPYRVDPPEPSTTLAPFYRLRLDPRNPSSRRN